MSDQVDKYLPGDVGVVDSNWLIRLAYRFPAHTKRQNAIFLLKQLFVQYPQMELILLRPVRIVPAKTASRRVCSPGPGNRSIDYKLYWLC
ncbi:hypothetical protein J6590_058093 [Homalodisca vitripennis]|nr:hypothetical protein J6590_058093 [Homalodisca vitripennis]